jgi:hypothetical protein
MVPGLPETFPPLSLTVERYALRWFYHKNPIGPLACAYVTFFNVVVFLMFNLINYETSSRNEHSKRQPFCLCKKRTFPNDFFHVLSHINLSINVC